MNHSEKCKVDKDNGIRNPVFGPLSCCFPQGFVNGYYSFWISNSLRIHVWYIHLHLVDFYGKCGEIYHTWILWDLVFEFRGFFLTRLLLGYTSKLQKRYAQAYINPGSVSLYPSMLQKNESWHIHRRSIRPGVESRMNNKRCAKKRGLHKHVTAWPFCW